MRPFEVGGELGLATQPSAYVTHMTWQGERATQLSPAVDPRRQLAEASFAYLDTLLGIGQIDIGASMSSEDVSLMLRDPAGAPLFCAVIHRH